MKKLIAFSTALLMLSAMSVSLVSAEEETAGENSTPVETESTEAGSGEEAEETPKQDVTVWHVHAAAPAEAEFKDDTENKQYVVSIVNPGGEKRGGTDKWDLQFRIKGLSIIEGHEYTLKYCISSDHAGSYYTKIGNPESKEVGEAKAGEAWHNQFGVSTIRSYTDGAIKTNAAVSYGDAWENQSISMGDTLNVESHFTGIADLPEAEWCFFLGGAGSTTSYDCFIEGTKVYFSNLVLTDNTTGETLVSAYPFVESKVKGDIDGDGVADVSDLSLMSLAMIGDTRLDDGQINNCDLDGDSQFTLADIAKLRQFISKIIEEL